MRTEGSEKFVKLMTGPSGRVGRILLGLLILSQGSSWCGGRRAS